jgi:hypothetical protein
MDRQPLFLVLVLVLAACGGGGDGVEPEPPAITPVGVAMGTPVTATIGAGGGELTSGDGRLTVVVPAGALAADAALSVQPITNLGPGGLGLAYRLGPEGATFLSPVTLRFQLAPPDLDGSGAIRIAYQDTDRSWRAMATTVAEGTATTTTTHFSDWSVMPGVRMTASPASVKVHAASQLKVVSCPLVEVDASGHQALAGCGSFGLAPERWAVNGTAGGNGTLGTVRGTGFTATFTAPASVPTPPTVQVSAEVPQGAGKAVVFANVRIVDEDQVVWGGESTATPMLDAAPDAVQWMAEAEFAFLANRNAPDHGPFLRGTVTVTRLPPAPAGPSDCTTTVTPDSQVLDITVTNTTGGVLIASDAGIYSGIGSILFEVTTTLHCPHQPDTTTESDEHAVFLATGPPAPYGGSDSIQGTYSQEGDSWEFHFYPQSGED